MGKRTGDAFTIRTVVGEDFFRICSGSVMTGGLMFPSSRLTAGSVVISALSGSAYDLFTQPQLGKSFSASLFIFFVEPQTTFPPFFSGFECFASRDFFFLL